MTEKMTNYIKSGKRAYFTQLFITSAKGIKVIWTREDGIADLFEYRGQLFKFKKATGLNNIYHILERTEVEVEVQPKKRRIK